MAGVIENYLKFEVCAVIRILQPEGARQNEIGSRLMSVYDRKVFSVCVVQQI
jgi:hypothetical protein